MKKKDELLFRDIFKKEFLEFEIHPKHKKVGEVNCSYSRTLNTKFQKLPSRWRMSEFTRSRDFGQIVAGNSRSKENVTGVDQSEERAFV